MIVIHKGVGWTNTTMPVSPRSLPLPQERPWEETPHPQRIERIHKG